MAEIDLIRDPARMTCPSSSTIREAMETIGRGAGQVALLLDPEDRFEALVSDGDIRRALLAGARLDDPVLPHAVRAPLVVSPAESRSSVLEIMMARRVSQVPVLDDDRRIMGVHLLSELLTSSPRRNVALVLAGGKGTRLHPLTVNVPKPMIRVAGRPILERLILHLAGHGISEIVLSIGYLGEQIEEFFGDGSHYGCRIDYLREEPTRPLGTGGPLRLLADQREVTQPVLVLNGDLVTHFDLSKMLDAHDRHGREATVAVRSYTHQIPFGVIVEDEDGGVAAIDEKPIISRPVSAGIYVISPSLIDSIPRDCEFPITDLLTQACERRQLMSWELLGDWTDVGRHEDLSLARGVVQ